MLSRTRDRGAPRTINSRMRFSAASVVRMLRLEPPAPGPHKYHNMRALTLVLCVASLTSWGCGSPDDDVEAVPQPIFSDIQQKILTPSCAAFTACHNAAGQAAKCDLTAGKAYAELVGSSSTTNPAKELVVPGDPSSSFLVAKLRGELAEGEGEPMPLRNPSLSEAKIQAIEAWIAAGAPNN
jgi:hypothetical protein